MKQKITHIEPKERIEYLDGLRAVAIVLVILFHAYARWPEVVPYGDLLSGIPIFKYGWLGVQLFFLISGFVILMTLEKCPGRMEFIYRRWLRLFPAMLFCSLLVFFTSGLFPERPSGRPDVENLIPGLTFIEPSWWSFLLGHTVVPLEGAFWSLFVEFKFYLLSAIIFYWRGRNVLIGTLAFAFISSVGCRAAEKFIGGDLLAVVGGGFRQLSFEHFGWFASGAAFYVYHKGKDLKWLSIAFLLAGLSSVFVRGLEWRSSLAACVISALFGGAVVFPQIQNLLRNSFLLLLGFISYPLYLIHENLMVAGIVKAGSGVPLLVSVGMPLVIIILLSIVAYVIGKYIEPEIRKFIKKTIEFRTRERTQ